MLLTTSHIFSLALRKKLLFCCLLLETHLFEHLKSINAISLLSTAPLFSLPFMWSSITHATFPLSLFILSIPTRQRAQYLDFVSIMFLVTQNMLHEQEVPASPENLLEIKYRRCNSSLLNLNLHFNRFSGDSCAHWSFRSTALHLLEYSLRDSLLEYSRKKSLKSMAWKEGNYLSQSEAMVSIAFAVFRIKKNVCKMKRQLYISHHFLTIFNLCSPGVSHCHDIDAFFSIMMEFFN